MPMAVIRSKQSREQMTRPTVTNAIMESFPAKAPRADIITTIAGTSTLVLLSCSL